MNWVAVALGSALGGLLRFGIVSAAARFGPWPILGINIAGSFLLGYLSARAAIPPAWRAGLSAGFCGGFTTFSTFSWDAVQLFQRNGFVSFTYVVVSVTGAIAAAWLGQQLATNR